MRNVSPVSSNFYSAIPNCVLRNSANSCHDRDKMTSKHTGNGQTHQLCYSGSHCWDHEPALVRLSEKTSQSQSSSMWLLSSVHFTLCVFGFSWSLLWTHICCFIYFPPCTVLCSLPVVVPLRFCSHSPISEPLR